MYAEDSFFNLSGLGQIGLVIWSALLACATVLICRRVLRGRLVMVQLLGAALIFWAFVWLSPQAYYQYYRIIIDGLPQQIVIQSPPTPWHVIQKLIFAGPANLSEHSQGALGWIMMLCATVKNSCPRRNAAN